MIIEKNLNGTELTVAIVGRLDTTTAPQLEAEFKQSIDGALVFGLGLCLAMQVIGSGVLMTALGVLLGILGIGGMIVAYPIYRKVFTNAKTKYAPRILELTAELTCGKNSAL